MRMHKVTCDRCGNTVDLKEISILMYHPVYALPEGWASVVLDMDVCPKCLEDVKVFLNEENK